MAPCSFGPQSCEVIVNDCYATCEAKANGCRGGCRSVSNCSTTESCEGIVITWNYSAIFTTTANVEYLLQEANRTHAVWAGHKSPALPQHELLIKSALTPGKKFEIFCAAKSYVLEGDETEP